MVIIKENKICDIKNSYKFKEVEWLNKLSICKSKLSVCKLKNKNLK